MRVYIALIYCDEMQYLRWQQRSGKANYVSFLRYFSFSEPDIFLVKILTMLCYYLLEYYKIYF